MPTVLETLTKVQYVAQDFTTYEEEVLGFLKEQYPEDYDDYVENNLGTALMQLWAYSCQGLAFYMNRRTTDLNITTAITPNAVSNLARRLNYLIEGASSSSTDLTVTLKNGPYTFPIPIYKGFTFLGPNSLIFEYRNDETVIYEPGETVKEFTVYEGETLENVFISTGESNQIFKLTGIPSNKFLVGASIEVIIKNEAWTERLPIPYAAGNYFEVNYLGNPPEVKFGDNIAGNIPAKGEEIRIRFAYCSGVKGRVSKNTIQKANETLVVRSQSIALIIDNVSGSSGGEDYEDLRKVKNLAPAFFQSQNRAVTKPDYDVISNTYPGVAKANSHINRTVEDDTTIQSYLQSILDKVSGCSESIVTEVSELVSGLNSYLNDVISSDCAANIVQVDILSKDSNNYYTAPSEGLKEQLRLHLQERADITHVVKTTSGMDKLVYASILVRVKVNKNAVRSEVLTRVYNSLAKRDVQPFGLLVLREAGESLYKWQIQNKIKEAQVNESDIDYADIIITGDESYLDATGNLIIGKNQTIEMASVGINEIIS